MTTTLVILAGVALIAALMLLRGFVLSRARGHVPCSLRTETSGWKSGVARYADGELHWIPFLGLRLRPRHAIARRGLTVSARRPLGGGLWAVDCGAVSLAMSEDALTGFLAWLESAPPGAHLDMA
ncbi:Protein of unknown function [Sinosporangium album]|uniref:DUF2550 domain-containing protein n=1 Tax=Sinosporangium album TaxID=504805 RepID=A0A1G7V4L0_9ACTN|nr:DUF2550 domain-containing protein [Sinosporangium album]SDG54451.1 Protein of unknown function [Sinosporangium album]